MIAGIDTHKDTLAVAVVDDGGRLIAGGDIPNTERGSRVRAALELISDDTSVGAKANRSDNMIRGSSPLSSTKLENLSY